ncbi:LOW QUALITY PROTEIN: uncharacterized protein C2orf73-like [Haliotis rubra]|uniref:LOW QUALITY PROTEIN: uncharacterized protein C2orf73-like n=1 Tax=Haliotis rubra TaxID=36100 RepID=UPI001EE5ED81|nr:LOW QUALITY PROTEIN: uncharacterized protein C2orf73-like [Haliotis rubra]
MATYMPPIARKKRVPEKYNPDSFRVVSLDAENVHPKFQDAVIKPVYASDPRPARKLLPDITIRETRVLPYTTPDFRAHNPQPMSCGFLRHDARLLNEPVCTVFTRSTYPDQHNWWPSRTSSDPLNIPEYTRDTTQRADFQFSKESASFGSTRHLANPNKEPALGTVPVNFLRSRSGDQRLYKEGISFEHQYDSRADPNYPIRSKRHGAFVWDQMRPDKAQLLIDYHKSVEAKRDAEAQEALAPTPPPGSCLPQPQSEMMYPPAGMSPPVPACLETPTNIPQPPAGPISPPLWTLPVGQSSFPPPQTSPQNEVPAMENEYAEPEQEQYFVQDVGTSTAHDGMQ